MVMKQLQGLGSDVDNIETLFRIRALFLYSNAILF